MGGCWIPIAFAPKDGRALVGANIEDGQVLDAYLISWDAQVEMPGDQRGCWCGPEGYDAHHPTHWIPMPEVR